MKCDDPFFVNARTGDRVPIRCGKCPPCKLERVNSWVFRLMQEEKRHTVSHFITLTYDTDHVPISDNGYMTLRKKDTQDFWKRLRKAHPELNIKYYLVGEYGTKNKRPHYHAIVFGVPDSQYYADAWSPYGHQLGTLHVGTVTGDSIAYCMKYIDKPRSRKHVRDDRENEFSTSSQALGANYITQEVVDYHNEDLTRNYLTKQGGYRIALPRYYRNIIYSPDDRLKQIAIIQNAVERADYEQRLNIERMYSGTGLIYERWAESAKSQRNKSFYLTQKDRDI